MGWRCIVGWVKGNFCGRRGEEKCVDIGKNSMSIYWCRRVLCTIQSLYWTHSPNIIKRLKVKKQLVISIWKRSMFQACWKNQERLCSTQKGTHRVAYMYILQIRCMISLFRILMVWCERSRDGVITCSPVTFDRKWHMLRMATIGANMLMHNEILIIISITKEFIELANVKLMKHATNLAEKCRLLLGWQRLEAKLMVSTIYPTPHQQNLRWNFLPLVRANLLKKNNDFDNKFSSSVVLYILSILNLM